MLSWVINLLIHAKTFNVGGAALTLPTGTGSANQVIKVPSISNGISSLTFGDPVTFPTISSISPSVIENMHQTL